MINNYFKLKHPGKAMRYYSALVVLMLFSGIAKAQLTYCVAANTDPNAAGSLMSNVTFGSINNTTGSTYPTNGYSYWPALTTSVIIGSTESLTISIDPPASYSGAIVSVWIDWDQDGTFSASEWLQVGTNIVNGTPATISISIPSTATAGLTRMRIRSRGTGNTNGSGDPCTSMGSGETEDYDISVVPATSCTATPTAGVATTTTPAVCPNQTYGLFLSGATVASGITYQWEESAVGLNTWNPISGATNPTYSTTMVGDMDYHCILTCTGIGSPATSTPVTVTQNPFYNCYCASLPLYQYDGEIFNVALGQLNNTTNCSQTGGPGSVLNRYSDYTTLITADTLYQDAPYPVSVTAGSCGGNYSAYVKVFMDLDHDGAFTTSGEELFAGVPPGGLYTTTGVAATGIVTIPSTSSMIGLTRMRVIMMQATNAALVLPCTNANYNYGETEDYAVYIPGLAPACGTVVAGTITVDKDSVCTGEAFNLNASGYTSGQLGIAYQWEESPAGASTWTPLANATNPFFSTTHAVSGDYDYRLSITCNSGTPAYSNIVSLYQSPGYYCYCSPFTGNTLHTCCGNYISNVTVSGTTLNNSSTTTGSGFYTRYKINVATGDLAQGVTYPLTVTNTYTGTSYGVDVWIDWDQSGTFDAGEYIPLGAPATGNVLNTNITVPTGISTGLIGMRLRAYYSTPFGASNACVSNGYETEDYVINITPQPSCLPPSVLNLSAITAVSADLAWTEMGSAAQWEVEYGNSPLTIGAGTRAVAGTNPYSISSLSPQTTYQFYVRAICGPNDTSTWSGPYAFTTPCLPVTALPWTEGFEGLTSVGSTNFPGCWSKQNGDWSTAVASSYNTANTGVNYLRDAWSATNEYMWTPGFQLTAGISYDFSFYVQGDGAPSWTVDVFYNNVQNSTGSTQLGSTYNVPGTSCCSIQPYYKQTYTFVPATTDVYYFATRVNEPTGGPWYTAFDDFMMETTPTCPAPTLLTAQNVTTTTADIGWTSTAAQSQIEYGPAPLTIGTGTRVNASANPTTITALLPSTSYAYYVRDICGPGDTSLWTPGTSFLTQCVAFASPFTESFNSTSTPTCWTNSGIVPNGWGFGNGYSSPDYDIVGATDHTGAPGSTYAWVDGSYVTNNGVATLTSPIIDISTLTAPQVRYYMISYYSVAANGNNKLTVDAYDFNISDWVQVDSVQQSFSSAAWNERSAPLSGVTSTTTQLRFRYTGTAVTPFYNDILIDDVNVENIPTCISPASLTATNATAASVDLGWTSAASQFEIEYAPNSTFTPGAGTRVGPAGITNPYTLGGLTPGAYTYFVRAICGPNDTSSWSSRSIFAPLPPNDDCAGAIDISNGVATSGYNIGATQSQAACDATPTAYDVWYTFTTGSTAGNVTVTVNTTTTGVDAVMQAFSGSCGSLTTMTATSYGTSSSSTCVDGPAAGIETATYPVAANTTYYVRMYSYNTTSTGTFSIQATGSPLAIKLDKIAAINAGTSNRVEWNTLSEEKTDKFELQRSADGKNFEGITKMNAKGEASHYTYMDNSPVQGYNYYRLLMKETNGKGVYSQTVKAFVKTTGFTVEAFPNPVSQDLTVRVSGIQGSDATVQVTDVTGKIIRTIMMSGSQETINMNGLANGIYLIKYSDANNTQTIKVNKQ